MSERKRLLLYGGVLTGVWLLMRRSSGSTGTVLDPSTGILWQMPGSMPSGPTSTPLDPLTGLPIVSGQDYGAGGGGGGRIQLF